jgi:cell division protein FtsB
LEKYQRELEAVRRENDELAEENMNLKIKSERDQREIDSLKKLNREREEDARRRTDALERRNKELEADIHKLNN